MREMPTKANLPEASADEAAPVRLEGILDPDRILCDVHAGSKKRALDILSELLSNGEQPLRKIEVFNCLVSRERLGSTAIGSAVAIPHARINQVTDLRAAFVRLSEPVEFDAADGQPVRFLFGLLVPPGDEDIHLQLLSTIARMLASNQFLESLRDASDDEELYELLVTFDPGDDAPDHH